MIVNTPKLKKMAIEALATYNDETWAGGEPVYPQWADNILRSGKEMSSSSENVYSHPKAIRHDLRAVEYPQSHKPKLASLSEYQ